MIEKTLRALSVVMFAVVLVACGGGSSSSSGGSSSSSGSSTITILDSFEGTNGANPQDGLIQGSDGNFYGTTYGGGTSATCTGGCGTIFKVSPTSGAETVLYSFEGGSSDGSQPFGLIQGSDGNFYGTTEAGGPSANCTDGCGTIFEFSPTSGAETVLHSFEGGSSDGANPQAGLVQGSDGNFYGTTEAGGPSANCTDGCGTIFEFSPTSGAETVLHFFEGGSSDGANPLAGLIQGSDGNFYGTTYRGGASATCTGGCGTIFGVSPTSGIEAVLYSFESGGSDGAYPEASLIQVSDGNFYGTTYGGGTNCVLGGGCGTIFEFSPSSGTETVLYSFGNSGDGISPNGLIQGSDGNLYGTTYGGGTSANCTHGCGTVFEFSPTSGTETVLHDFGSFSGDGEHPFAGSPILGSDGNFYGTTYYGGTENDGTVFEVALQ